MYFGGLLLSLLVSCDVRITEDPFSIDIQSQSACRYNPKGLKQSMKSSVLISFMVDGEQVGKASGNYFKHRGNTFVITAAHVADAAKQSDLIVNERLGVGFAEVEVAYVNQLHDLAILKLKSELNTVDPIKWRRKDRWELDIGEPLYYTGHPMDLDHISFNGTVAKVYQETIVMQGFAYMGSSGSAVFDKRGRVVGVISAIKFDVPGGAFPQLIPSIVMIGGISALHDGELHSLLEAAGE